jgi:hypothetical protein
MNSKNVSSSESYQDVKDACQKVLKYFLHWIENHGYYSYDQYDFWATTSGKLAKRAYYRNHMLGLPLVIPLQLLDWLVPSSRSLFAKKTRFPIADAHFIMGYLNMFQVTQDESFLEKAATLSGELLISSIAGYSGYCWGYPFDWQTNRGLWKSNTPLITSTPYCFEAFLGLYDCFHDQKYLDAAYSIATFASNDLKETYHSEDACACSYSPMDVTQIVNASAYRAFLLLEAYHRFGDNAFEDKAVKNINFILRCQESSGAWLYAIGNPQDAFVDNFHTCFVLKNLYKANMLLQRADIKEAIIKGYDFYKETLLTDEGLPKPFALLGRAQLVKTELYDYAEGISLGVLLRDDIDGAFALAVNLAWQVYANYRVPAGHFTTRVSWGGVRNCVPYLRWPQAQMFFAFTILLKTLLQSDVRDSGNI